MKDPDFIPDEPDPDFIPDEQPAEKPGLFKRFGQGVKKGFKRSDDPTASTAEEVGRVVGRYGPMTAGSLAAGALTGGAGLLPAAAAQFLGAGAGEAYGQLASRAAGGKAPGTAKEAAKDIASTGAEAAAAELGIGLIGKGAKALRPAAEKLGTQLLKVGQGIPEKYGAAALKDLGALARAKSPETVGQAYQAFEKYAGLKGLGKIIEERGVATIPTGELEQMVVGTANKVRAGVKVTKQELYSASQAASHLKLAAKYGEPGAARALESGIITSGKKAVEDAMEKILPEYKNLRTDYFESKMAQQFKSLLPLAKNQSANVLRGLGAVGGAVAATRTDDPRALVLPLLFSPRFAGAAIRTTSRVGKVAAPVARVARKIAPAGATAIAPVSNFIRLVSPSGQEQEVPREMADRLRENGWKDAP